MRKLSGFTRPSKANEAAFDRAVHKVSLAARELIDFARHHCAAARPRGRGRQSPRAVRGALPPAASTRRARKGRQGPGPQEHLPASRQDELLRTLVGFDTTSAKSNLALIAFVEDYLKGHGIASTRVPSPDGTKADLFATIGETGAGGIGLSGHSDCVPVEGQRWSSDPFTLTERDGKLYARGACDMKGFLACVLASVPLFRARKLKEPIHIIVSYDEEVGCTGVRPLIARLGADLPRPRAIIVGEPTSMRVIDAHKRIDSYRTRVTGREAHSSMPDIGVNAISAAAALIGELERLGADIAARQNDPRFEPPYSTVSVGTIKGGTAPNIVPKIASSNGRCAACRARRPPRSRATLPPSPRPRCCRACCK